MHLQAREDEEEAEVNKVSQGVFLENQNYVEHDEKSLNIVNVSYTFDYKNKGLTASTQHAGKVVYSTWWL